MPKRKVLCAVVTSILLLTLGQRLRARQDAEPAARIWPRVRLVTSVRSQDTRETLSINVDRYPKGRLDPVEITKIMEGDHEIVPGVYRVPPNDAVGQPNPYSDDWIDKLSYTFKNLTSRKIEFMSIGMSFHFGDHDNWQQRVTWHLHLGEVPPLAVATYYAARGKKPPSGKGNPLEFGPGQEMTIRLAGERADEIKTIIEGKMPLSSVTECFIAVSLVCFDQPSLKWGNYGFGWAVADPNSSNGYRKMVCDFPLDVSHATWDKPPRAVPPDIISREWRRKLSATSKRVAQS